MTVHVEKQTKQLATRPEMEAQVFSYLRPSQSVLITKTAKMA